MTNVTAIMLAAIMHVESGGTPSTIGKHGEVGPLQIRQCVIDDVNRIYDQHYTKADARDAEKSKEIAVKYLSWWVSKDRVNSLLKRDPKPRDYVLCWNRGPLWWKARYVKGPERDRYWQAVRRVMVTMEAKQEQKA